MPNKKISLTPSRKDVEDFIKAANTEADTVSRVPPIQNEHALVVVAACESEEAGQIRRANLARLTTQACGSYLAAAPETLPYVLPYAHRCVICPASGENTCGNALGIRASV